MRLVEFLDQYIPAHKLINYIDNQYGILMLPVDNIDLNWSIHSFVISRSDLKIQLEHLHISIKSFEEILQKYGWYISYIRGDRLNLTVENNKDLGYYSNENAIFHNKYLHITNIQPSRINAKGLLAKNSTDPNVEKDLTMQRGIIYPNKRIYLWSLEAASGNLTNTSKNFNARLLNTFSTILNGLHAKTYGNYIYLITLSNSIKPHYDNEYGTDLPARYCTQNIPPNHINYIGTIDRLEEILETNNYKRLKQIMKLNIATH